MPKLFGRRLPPTLALHEGTVAKLSQLLGSPSLVAVYGHDVRSGLAFGQFGNSPMKIIDSHTHVSGLEFDQDRADILKRAFEVCEAFIDVGCGKEADSFQRAKNLAESDERIYFTAGVHPHDAEAIGKDKTRLEEILSLVKHPKFVALGECGLDYFYDHSPRDLQKQVFAWHIQKAEELQIPLMIHTRDAEADTKELLHDFSGTAIFHCFTGTKELALFGVDKGFFVSFSGIITFKKAENVREAFDAIPLKNILIETDAPYLAPNPKRGKRNEPHFIQHTAQYLADLRKMKLDDFIKATSDNARRAFPKMIRG